MPIAGRLVLKGGETLGGVKKRQKKKKQKEAKIPSGSGSAETVVNGEGGERGEGAVPTEGPSRVEPETTPQGATGGKAYEEEFEFEMERMNAGKVSNTPWGSSYRALPKGKVLHGYDRAVHGNTVEERLDLRCASKTDKFCK